MTTKSGWPTPSGVQTMYLERSLGAESAAGRPIEPALSREAFRRLLTFERRDEDRRLSAAAAFFMFLFGCGCGGTWTLILTWLF